MGSSRGPSDTVQAAQQTSRSHAILLAAWALLAILAVTGSRSAVASQVTSLPEGLLELATAPGYRVEIDSSGFDLPTAIAFIPQPGE